VRVRARRVVALVARVRCGARGPEELVMAVTRGLPPAVVDVAAAAVRGERRLSAETTASSSSADLSRSSCAILCWTGWFSLDVWCCVTVIQCLNIAVRR
jgi:hypothetical protein